MSILVVGDAMIDRYIELTTVRQSPEGVPIVERREWEQPGGALAVQSMCEALGAETSLLAADNQDCIKIRTVLDGVVLFREDEDHVGYLSKPWTMPDDVEVILVADYRKCTITRRLIRWLIDSGKPVIVDPRRGGSPGLYVGCWAIVPNLDEDRGCFYFSAFGRAILKMGAAGMLAKEGRRVEHFHALNREPFDVCGAGDQVLATLGVCIARGMSWFDAAAEANRAAGIKCRMRGTTPVMESELWPQESLCSAAAAEFEA